MIQEIISQEKDWRKSHFLACKKLDVAQKFVLSRKKNFKLDEMQSTNAAAAPEPFAMKREGCGAFVLSACVLLRAWAWKG